MDQRDRDGLRRERVVKNEHAFRDYNDRRVAVEEHAIIAAPAPWVCGCGDSDCIRALQASVDEFETAHSAPDRFIVVPGHVYSDVERVVEKYDRYWVVEKFEGEMHRVAG